MGDAYDERCNKNLSFGFSRAVENDDFLATLRES